MEGMSSGIIGSRLRTAVACALLPLQLAACVTYLPIDPREAGSEPVPVRVIYSPEGAVRATTESGRVTRSLDGELLGVRFDSLRIRFMRNSDFGARLARRDSVSLPFSDVAEVLEKRVSRSRTALAIGAGSLGVLAIAVALWRSAGGGGDEGDTPPDQLIVPVFFRIR